MERSKILEKRGNGEINKVSFHKEDSDESMNSKFSRLCIQIYQSKKQGKYEKIWHFQAL